MYRQLASWLISGLILTSPSFAQTEGTLDRIERTGVLKVALREDAPPFGYLDDNDNLQGYCLDFLTLLESRLTKKLERNSLSIKLYKSTTTNRFNLVSRDVIDLECGPNTIRSDVAKNVGFSAGFLVTGTQFLIDRNRQLDLESDLNGKRLGVMNNTTTEEFVARRYPLATIRKYSGVTARTRGIEAVAQGRLDAMISDGVLLRAEARQQGLSSARYPIIPNLPLTCDRYGMIIQDEDPQWRDFVNSVINSPKAAALSNAWFGELVNYTRVPPDLCQ